MLRALLLFALPLLPAADLLRDDFSRLPAGLLSQPVGQLNGAIQEYHYLPHRGVDTGVWKNAIVHQDAWVVSEEDGRPYIEQHLATGGDRPGWSQPLFVAGDAEWHSYSVSVRVKPLLLRTSAGIAFRYRTNRDYWYFALQGGTEVVLRKRLPIDREFRKANWQVAATAPFPHDVDRYFELRIENDGPRMKAYVDGRLLLEASDESSTQGRIALSAEKPARFQQVLVSASNAVAQQIRTAIARRGVELANLQANNPKPKLWKSFRTPGFGAGRNVRFGDLDGDGQEDMLIAQNIPRVRGDAFDAISCLTAVTMDGRVLWQKGKPDPRNGLLTNDTPFQIHDLEGDGRAEVVLVRDFQLQILDGRTGERKLAVPMPAMNPTATERPYERVAGDAIAFLNLSGAKTPREILVKDRYRNFWLFDAKLQMLWKGSGQTGHFPYALDIDGDGREEFALGYTLWHHTGKALWSHDTEYQDHADGIVIGNFTGLPDGPVRVYSCGSDEGFLLWDRNGNLLKQTHIGHAQSPSVGKYRMDVPGLQLLTINYWYNPGIVSLFDADGKLLGQAEPIHSGSPVLPVNWRGDGQEYAMLSPHPSEGGMMNGQFQRAVLFPNDGHPNLAFHVMNLTGDARDEIVVWDTERVWIYTQDRPFTGTKIYAPIRNPEYNESNYRTTVSLPRWETVQPSKRAAVGAK
jgi:rhamnogalacturonan endolyase